MDGDELGRILEDRISKIIPPGFHVAYSKRGALLFSSDPGRFPGHLGNFRVGRASVHVRDNFSTYGDTHEERIVNACEEVLDALQDYIDEATHDPWPGDRTPPRPYAEVRDGVIFLGYGTPSLPVLEFEPVPLDAN